MDYSEEEELRIGRGFFGINELEINDGDDFDRDSLKEFKNSKELMININTCIYDFNPLTELQDIEKLYIYTDEYYNPDNVIDLEPIRHLKNLIEFEIFGFQFDNLGAIKNLVKLKDLRLWFRGSKLLFPFSKNIPINDCFINLDLKYLLIDSYIHNVELERAIGQMHNLECLWFKSMSLEHVNLEFLGNLKKLKDLSIFGDRYRKPVQLSGLKNLTNLRKLRCESFRGEELENIIINNVNLEELYLKDLLNFNINASVLSRHYKLKILELHNIDGVNNLTFLSSLHKIEKLSLDELTNISNIKELSNLKNVNKLRLSNMPLVDDISPIGDMTNLDKLVFSGMKKITGTKALNKLTKLNEVRTQNERPMTWFIWNGKNPRETQTREELLNLWLERLTYLA
jgi:hypothetical protein